jgi:NAD(P)H-hydrate epimerase
LVLDALIGYGLRNSPQGTVAELIRWANNGKASVLSLDVPSGIDATTGSAAGEYIRPRWTMTLALPKTGLWSAQTGDVFLADIGIPAGLYRRIGIGYFPHLGDALGFVSISDRTATKRFDVQSSFQNLPEAIAVRDWPVELRPGR